MNIEKMCIELGMSLKDCLITMLADDELFNLAFNYMDFNLLGKVVPKEYLLVRYDSLKKRGLIKELSEEK